jgi:hypothetical protein
MCAGKSTAWQCIDVLYNRRRKKVVETSVSVRQKRDGIPPSCKGEVRAALGPSICTFYVQKPKENPTKSTTVKKETVKIMGIVSAEP